MKSHSFASQVESLSVPSEFETCNIPELFESASSCDSLPIVSAQPIPSGTMIGMLRELEVKLCEQKRDFDLEKKELQAKSNLLSQSIIQLEEEKQLLSRELHLEQYKKCSSGLFSVKAQAELHNESSVNAKFTPNSLSNAIQTLLERLKETDPLLLSQKMQLNIEAEGILRFSDSMIESVKYELKNMLLQYQQNAKVSSAEASIIYLLVEEVCAVKKILNHFSKEYVVRMEEQAKKNSSLSQLGKSEKKGGIMRFFFK